jgi:hypothetical protein
VWVPESILAAAPFLRGLYLRGRARSGDNSGQLDRQDTQTDMGLPDGVTFVSADRGQENQHLPAVRHTALTASMHLPRLAG